MEQELKITLKKSNIRPKKWLGQHFLISDNVLEKIIETAELKPNDVVLEIGSGSGILTKELVKKVKKVIAVEKDPRMTALLKSDFNSLPNVEIVQGDILKFSIGDWQFSNKNYKLVANLPYYITAPVIKKFLEAENPPKLIVLLVQKEVAERICAVPPKMSRLAVFCQFYGRPRMLNFVSRKSFWPQPKVDSAILKIIPKKVFGNLPQTRHFVKLVKAGFSEPRKQLAKNLSGKLKLSRKTTEAWFLKNKINPFQRAETLRVEDWLRLAKTMPKESETLLVN